MSDIKIPKDMFGQTINSGDYVCCTSSSTSTGMYIGMVDKITLSKVQVTDTRGNRHQKDHKKVFVVTAQIENIPELMI